MGLARAVHLALEKTLFGTHPLALPLQKTAQLILNGPRNVEFSFTRGPAAGNRFSCLSSQKYFFVREDYESEILGTVERFVGPGAVAFDIGAHFGYWAALMGKLGATVFAFEPSELNREFLLRNVSEFPNVHIVPFAVSNRNGRTRIHQAGSMSKIDCGEAEIETVTLDEFCQSHPLPTFLLIDVEGSASNVIGGGKRVFGQGIPFVCEVHNPQEEQCIRRLPGNIANLSREVYPYRVVVS
jgi:FkbM family methyltransferase